MENLKIGSLGNIVSFLQLTLKNLGIYSGNVDGVFGERTLNSVKVFQERNSLVIDGIVGESTWNKLLPYISVPTTIPYSYNILMLNIQAIKLKYPFISISSIGISVMGKEIPYIKIGNGTKQLLYIAGTHANEWICCLLLMKFAEEYLKAYSNNANIQDISAKDIFQTTTLYIIPMVNPDGIDLVTNNIDTSSNSYINVQKIANNYPNIRFPDGWKANISGIDLNLQFPANWDQAKEIKYSQGFISPAPRDFVGDYPLQAPEAIALYDFTINHNFKIMLTYHTQGEVIYWKFLDYNPPNALKIGEKFASLSGYTLSTTPYSSSFAGYKDWFIQNYNLPGYTIEAGSGINPLPLSEFDKIYKDNIGILTQAPLM